ncbi:MAG TPA: L-2-hydroxyglutarate oxidase [Chthoniobacterales bacterium]|nr:L-2-hydroxyglutarate oxidase [Chthoniobacterales bacterium]
MNSYDFAVIGGGIVGLSSAMALGRRFPNAKIVVLEKERQLAAHQTGHNSGVIHSGIYYKPGSMKARLACDGRRTMIQFCRQHGIPHEVCGKIIVATADAELPLLENLYQRALQNGVEVEKLSPEQVREIEPHVSCIAALRVPGTGIVSYTSVCLKFRQLIEEQGGSIVIGRRVEKLVNDGNEKVVVTPQQEFRARFLINCGGLQSDRLARMSGADPGARIVPFRGEYYELVPEKRYLVKHLIYPVPDPAFPFLGVHFTRMIDGTVHAGPNAVLSFKREGYRKRDFNLVDLAEVLMFKGFWRLARKHARAGWEEVVRSWSKPAFVRSLQRLIPEVRAQDLVPTHAGVRAQALLDDGRLVDDFLIVRDRQALHVCNAPSPAATASIEIGEAIAAQVPEMARPVAFAAA